MIFMSCNFRTKGGKYRNIHILEDRIYRDKHILDKYSIYVGRKYHKFHLLTSNKYYISSSYIIYLYHIFISNNHYIYILYIYYISYLLFIYYITLFIYLISIY